MRTLLISFTLLFLFVQNEAISQDRLVFNDEKVVECKVLEVTPEVIKYTKHTMPDGPVYTVYKKEVNSIVFENGEIELVLPTATTQYGKEKRSGKRADWPVYKATWGLDILSPAFGELETWFEIRNEKNMVGHTISLTGFWNRNGYYYDDYAYFDCIDGFNCYDYYYNDGGGLAFAYAPKFYFIDHPVARPFAGPEAAMGMITSFDPAGYFHGMARVGVALTPKPRLNIIIDVAGGGYLIFDGYTNYGGGLINLGISLGVHFGDGKKRSSSE